MTTIADMLADFNRSQQEFLGFLDNVAPDTLYKQTGENWSVAQTLAHISEAREFFAGEVQRIVATPGAQVGRTIEDPHRLESIAAHSHSSLDELRERLVVSYQAVVQTLQGVNEDDLSLECDYINRGSFKLAEFIRRFVVGHDQIHLQQVIELSQSN